MNDFCNISCLKSLNRGPICFRNPNNPSCIDLFPNKSTAMFLTITCYWNGYFLLARNGSYCNENSLQKTKAIQYRYYNHFNEQSFNFEFLKIHFNNAGIKGINEFLKQILEKHAPGKQKYIRTKNSKYITKALPK